MSRATVMAGSPATNLSLFHRVRFMMGDPAAFAVLPDGRRVFICRDIEIHRAKEQARADVVVGPGAFEPEGGLSSDRATQTAQALAECLVREGVDCVRAGRSLGLVYVEHLRLRGIAVEYDADLGVVDRRSKDEEELEALRAAQAMTERAIELACTMIAGAQADASGVLVVEGEALTADRVRSATDVFLLEKGYMTEDSIVAGGIEGALCHNRGQGVLRTEEPVIIDIFPQSKATHYNGDCTRTVVHGDIPDEIARMHSAVVASKRAAVEATRAGVTGGESYEACIAVIREHGWDRALLPDDASADFCSMRHGLGHGVGLEVHEAPLLDEGGPELIDGDVVTIEPGLYHATLGGVRVEDMLVVRADGCENFNRLHEGLTWK
jgi:Xaa-Pro aminopeptidase